MFFHALLLFMPFLYRFFSTFLLALCIITIRLLGGGNWRVVTVWLAYRRVVKGVSLHTWW